MTSPVINRLTLACEMQILWFLELLQRYVQHNFIYEGGD